MVVRRGTSNSNSRGNSKDRRRRREWLVTTFQCDMTLYWQGSKKVYVHYSSKEQAERLQELGWTPQLLCRCYRCGVLLDVDTVSADRIIPGTHGGTYVRTNIRPACGLCNSITGGLLGAAQKAGQ